MRRFFLSMAVLGVAAGCTSVQSANIRTAGMSADMTVLDDGSGTTHVRMQLNDGANSIDLSNGDRLTASGGGSSIGMGRNDVVGDVYYTADFTNADAENTSFTVSFTRASDTSAPNSVVTLPKPFNITAPPAGMSFSRATDDIKVTYDTTGTTDGMDWQINGPCVNGGNGTVTGDTGSFTILHTSLPPSDMSEASMTCTVTVTLTRKRTGMVDPAYGQGGSATATQQRTVMFTSKP